MKKRSKSLSIYNTKIERVKGFLYLGRWIQNNDDETDCIDLQLKTTRKRWFRIAKLLKRTGANAKIMGTFYKTIISTILLYGSESWVINKTNLLKLQAFHHKCARQMCGNNIKYNPENDLWTYPKSEDVLKQCGLLPIEFYIQQRRNTIETYIKQRPIYNKCLASKPLQNNVNQLTWWTQKLNTF